jgi:hypothetical protein
LRIGHDTVESAIKLFGQVTLNLKMLDLAFEAAWLHEPRKLGLFWEGLGGLGASEMSRHG